MTVWVLVIFLGGAGGGEGSVVIGDHPTKASCELYGKQSDYVYWCFPTYKWPRGR